MYSVSTAYKNCMKSPIRNRAYMTIAVGVVNQGAQDSAYAVGEYATWSNKTLPFTNKEVTKRYATMEENYLKADGSMLFLPHGTYAQYENNQGITTKNIGDSIQIAFGNVYDIKGLTIDFDEAYPLKFNVVTDETTFSYDNDSETFTTTDNLGSTATIQIVPIQMVGGNQRLRINRILMGVGLSFTNNDIKDATHEEYVNAVTQELPYVNFSVNILDDKNTFNVENENSFINFLETGQKVEYSVGLELDDETVEYIPMGTLFLSEWKSTDGSMSFSATDRLSEMDDTYTAGNYIHTRTLYDDAVAVLESAGLEADEYRLDECLKDITVSNPLPESTHAECLQLIANAGRCKLYQNRSGLICIQANFAVVLNPDDYTVTTESQAEWSKPENVMYGSDIVYADMTNHFLSADGSMYFLPRNSDDYLETSFVSKDVSDENGNFEVNPNLTITLPAGYVYYSIYAKFDGNPPSEVLVTTYRNGKQQEKITFDSVESENWFSHEFKIFDEIKIEVTKAYPNSRVLVNTISFGELTDYTIRQDDMLEKAVGYQETKTKNVLVKIYSYEEDEDGTPQEVEDYNYSTYNVNTNGQTVTFENCLIGTEEHAKLIAEWLGNYYSNNISYEVSYRGEPRLNASDIVRLESEVKGNIQVEIETLKFTFDGTFNGSLSLRRATKNNGGASA